MSRRRVHGRSVRSVMSDGHRTACPVPLSSRSSGPLTSGFHIARRASDICADGTRRFAVYGKDRVGTAVVRLLLLLLLPAESQLHRPASNKRFRPEATRLCRRLRIQSYSDHVAPASFAYRGARGTCKLYCM